MKHSLFTTTTITKIGALLGVLAGLLMSANFASAAAMHQRGPVIDPPRVDLTIRDADLSPEDKSAQRYVLTVFGTGFTDGATVDLVVFGFGGDKPTKIPVVVKDVQDEQILGVITTEDLRVGSGSLTVTNLDGRSVSVRAIIDRACFPLTCPFWIRVFVPEG